MYNPGLSLGTYNVFLKYVYRYVLNVYVYVYKIYVYKIYV